jgi:hypothetical protein
VVDLALEVAALHRALVRGLANFFDSSLLATLYLEAPQHASMGSCAARCEARGASAGARRAVRQHLACMQASPIRLVMVQNSLRLVRCHYYNTIIGVNVRKSVTKFSNDAC